MGAGRALARATVAIVLAALAVSSFAEPAASEAPAAAAKKCRKGKKAKKCKKKKQKPSHPNQQQPQAPGPPPVTYVSLGDSVSAGFNATANHDYVSLLFAHYQATLGVNQLSRRAAAGTNSTELNGAQLTNALGDINGASDTRVVTIGIGGNDWLLNGCTFGNQACTTNFKTNFNQSLTQLQAALANDPGSEDLISLAYYNPHLGQGDEATLDDVLLGDSLALDCDDTGDEVGLNDAIAQVADAHGSLLGNSYPGIKAAGPSMISGDHIHPNDAGHQKIAEAFEAPTDPCP